MRRLSALPILLLQVLLLACPPAVPAFAEGTPAPTLAVGTITRAPKARVQLSLRAAGSVVWARYTVTATGGADSLVVTLTPTPGTVVTRSYAGAAKTDSVSFPRPAPSEKITLSLSAIAKRRGLPSPPSAAVVKSYTEPDVPPSSPTVLFEVVPASITIAPGATIGLCGLAFKEDGSSAIAPGSDPAACGAGAVQS